MQIDRNPVVLYGNFNAPLNVVHRSCEDLYTRVQRDKGGPPDLLMFVIRGKTQVIYEQIKQWCDTIRGVQSQAVDGSNVQRKGGDRAFHANLLLKINAKLGGTTVALHGGFTDARTPTVITYLTNVKERCLSALMSPMQHRDLKLPLLRQW